jgi:hypothetical protein
VYWALKSAESGGIAYDDYGQPQYTDPVEIYCRWDDVAVEFIDRNGTKQVSKSTVFVRQDLDIGGMLFHGTLAEVTSPDAPREQDNAWEIRQFGVTPHIKYKYKVRIAYL